VLVAAAVRRVTDLLVEILPLGHLPQHWAVAVAVKVPRQVRRAHLAAAVVLQLRPVVQEFLGKVMRVVQVRLQFTQLEVVVVDQVQ
jgi:hypothetical protein